MSSIAPRQALPSGGPPLAQVARPSARQLPGRIVHVVERFTHVDASTLLYRSTIDDPDTWDRSCSGEYSWPATDKPIYKYACHEGNYKATTRSPAYSRMPGDRTPRKRQRQSKSNGKLSRHARACRGLTVFLAVAQPAQATLAPAGASLHEVLPVSGDVRRAQIRAMFSSISPSFLCQLPPPGAPDYQHGRSRRMKAPSGSPT
jgi:hypothetical protein